MSAGRLTVAGAAAIAALFLLAPAVLAADPDMPGASAGGDQGQTAGQPAFGDVSSETATAAAPTVLPARGATAPADVSVLATTGNVLAAGGDALAGTASVGGSAASAADAVLAKAGIPVGVPVLGLPALGLGLLLRPLRIRT